MLAVGCPARIKLPGCTDAEMGTWARKLSHEVQATLALIIIDEIEELSRKESLEDN